MNKSKYALNQQIRQVHVQNENYFDIYLMKRSKIAPSFSPNKSLTMTLKTRF